MCVAAPVGATKMLLVLIALSILCQYAAAKKTAAPDGIGYGFSSKFMGRPIPFGYLPFNATVAEGAGWTKTSKIVEGLGVEYTHAAAAVAETSSDQSSTETSVGVQASSSPFLLYYTDGQLTAIRVTGPQTVDKSGNPVSIPGTIPSNISGSSGPLMDYVIKFSSDGQVTVGNITIPPYYRDADALGWEHGACMKLMGGVHYLITPAASNLQKYTFAPIYDRYGPLGKLSALQLGFGLDNRTRKEFDLGGAHIPGKIGCSISYCGVPECVDSLPEALTAVHMYLAPLRVNKLTGAVKGAKCNVAADAVCNAKRGRAAIRSVIVWLKNLGK